MSSAEVYCWGSLGFKESSGRGPSPLEDGRTSLVQRVHAGFACAALVGSRGTKWINAGSRVDRNASGLRGTCTGGAPTWDGVAFGQTHTLLLRNVDEDHVPAGALGDGKGYLQVFSSGVGRQGQLGQGAAALETEIPQHIKALDRWNVTQVACGAQHSAALTSVGDLFTWGRGNEGQLGHGSRHLPRDLNNAISGVQFRPKAVPTFLATKKRSRPVAGVSCGHNFTVVVTCAGAIWAFGEGAAGQLGIGRVTRVGVPTLVTTECPLTGQMFVEVSAGWAHTLARTAGGDVFSWGFNALGSLGLCDNRTRFTPQLVQLDPERAATANVRASSSTRREDNMLPIKPIIAAVKVRACGNCSGALSAQGRLFTWGSSEKYQLGHGEPSAGLRSSTFENVSLPRQVMRLAKAEITDFALSGSGGVALVPLRTTLVSPTSGPLETGCDISINGYAFWDSPDIVVKFTPITKGHKLLAARSAVGTYIPCDSDDQGEEQLRCTTPRFTCPGEVFVEVSMDGVSFTSDRCKFNYYHTPDIVQITPSVCRPPFSRIRLDGEKISPNASLSVRFEEVVGCDIFAGEGEKSSLGGDSTADQENAKRERVPVPALIAAFPPRVFTVQGRIESEVIEVGIDRDTEQVTREQRWFITCDAPPLEATSRLPFISRVTVAPNGVTFQGRPLLFTAHDPRADCCEPIAVPAPVPCTIVNDGDEADCNEVLICVTGRHLYGGTGLTARLRFGGGRENVVTLDAVTFKTSSQTVTAALPKEASDLVAPEAGAGVRDNSRPAAISVAVEVSIDGEEYFAVPHRITLYAQVRLTLKGDGMFAAAEGGCAELVPGAPIFRGYVAQVRLLSTAHGLDIVLPLLPVRPTFENQIVHQPLVESAECGQSSEETQTSHAAALASRSSPYNSRVAEFSPAEDGSGGNDGGLVSDEACWEEREVSISADPFFFTVPPVPAQGRSSMSSGPSWGSSGALEPQDSLTTAAGDGAGAAVPPRTSPNSWAEFSTERDNTGFAPSQDADRTLSISFTLNGRDWRPVEGPPLTYFHPPPEPEEPDPAELKRHRGKKK